MPYSVGDTVVLDGIESVIIYKADTEQDWGQYIVTDKNHDLCYYILGNDFVNNTDYETNKWGPEWGGWGITTNVTSQAIGGGLSNTNTLIGLDLQPYHTDWPILWNWLATFRSTHSDKWFVPSYDETLEIYNQQTYLQNLSTLPAATPGYPYYWTSTEYDVNRAYYLSVETGYYTNGGKGVQACRARLCRYTNDLELSLPKVGDTYTLDGIESVIVYDAGSEQSWGRYILADKNHDLSYYISGSDFSDNEESDDVINTAATYGYEWGGYGTTTGITSQEIGDGLNNTNSLINLNLQPQTDGWKIVWNVVSQFRSSHSDNWFVPTLNELQQVCNQKSFLENLSNVGYNHYWSSSEYSDLAAWQIIFAGNLQIDSTKNLHSLRTRLCRYATFKELTGTAIGDTVVLDGIESTIIYDAGSNQEWGRYIVADKNHDLCYYIDGDDYVDSENYTTPPGTFGYEWGAWETTVGVDSEEIGTGLNNTDSLIKLDLQPDASGWRLLWDMVSQFRSSYTNKWFIPSYNELKEVFNQRKYLNNISTINYTSYWTSSEMNRTGSRSIVFQEWRDILGSVKNSHMDRSRLCRYTTDEELNPPKVGDIFTLDGVESVIIYDAGREQSWGRYILADKNHDLSYYISGDDYVNTAESDSVINTSAKYGYEWGGYKTRTNRTSQAIGDGLNNTNTLISRNLQPDTEGWWVLWDMVEQFRSSHSDDWFVPTLQELEEVFNQRLYLSNLTTSLPALSYWTSTEFDDSDAYSVSFETGANNPTLKFLHDNRTRLCRYATLDLLTGKSVNITCSTPSASIHYTTDNSSPSSSSTLYSNTFLAEEGTIIKAIGIKEGWLDSDIATYTIPN